MGKVEDKMRPTDPVIILIGRTIERCFISSMNVGKYIVYSIKLNLQKGDDYLSDRMPIWFSNTRYYREKRIVDNALKSVYRVKVRQTPSMFQEQNIKDFKGTDHTPLDLGYREEMNKNKAKRFRDNEFEGDNFPDVVMNGNWKQVHR
jgi:hypothetical protein